MSNELNKYKDFLLHQQLKGVYHSEMSKARVLLEGLGPAYYFSTILELENGECFALGENWIEKYTNGKEKLTEITHQNWIIDKEIIYKGKSITDILTDEYGAIYIKLENDILIFHNIDYGDDLLFKKYEEVFDNNDKLTQD